MSRNRGTTDESSIRSLKKRLRYLERENSRLRKIARRLEVNQVEPDDDETVEPPKQPAAPVYDFRCTGDKCQGTEYDKLELSIRGAINVYLLCKDCGKSHRVKK